MNHLLLQRWELGLLGNLMKDTRKPGIREPVCWPVPSTRLDDSKHCLNPLHINSLFVLMNPVVSNCSFQDFIAWRMREDASPNMLELARLMEGKSFLPGPYWVLYWKKFVHGFHKWQFPPSSCKYQYTHLKTLLFSSSPSSPRQHSKAYSQSLR